MESLLKKRVKGGQFCIAPGCNNEFYSVKHQRRAVHFHTLPVKRPEVLKRWLVALNRDGRPFRCNSRVCSDHFLKEDYLEDRYMEADVLVVRRTNRLKYNVVPSVFNNSPDMDNSSDKSGRIDHPTESTSKVAVHQKERGQRHPLLAVQREQEDESLNAPNDAPEHGVGDVELEQEAHGSPKPGSPTCLKDIDSTSPLTTETCEKAGWSPSPVDTVPNVGEGKTLSEVDGMEVEECSMDVDTTKPVDDAVGETSDPLPSTEERGCSLGMDVEQSYTLDSATGTEEERLSPSGSAHSADTALATVDRPATDEEMTVVADGVVENLCTPPETITVQSSADTNGRNARDSTYPLMKIKDEPVDEEYDHALVPHQSAGHIKDEPDTTEEFSQQGSSSEELKISAVFSVSGNSAPAAPASSSPYAKLLPLTSAKTLTVTMTPGPLPPVVATPPATPANSVRVSCSGCKKVLLKGQTAYQRKGSSQLFCSTICLTGYNVPTAQPAVTKTCHYCLKEITNPKDVISSPVDTAGTLKDFCSQSCLSAFDLKTSKPISKVSTEGVTIKCSMCQKIAIIRHEVNYQGSVHKLCSDACFTSFRSTNRLTMNCCENCGGYCYNRSGQCHMLQIEGSTRKFCSPTCITIFKRKSGKVTPCAMCFTLRSSAEMLECVTSEGKTELFCSTGCMTTYKVQAIRNSGNMQPCSQCKVATVPQYHLAMSDGSMRNFCTYDCVVTFQAEFSKTPTLSQPVSVAQTAPAPLTVSSDPLVTTVTSLTAATPTAVSIRPSSCKFTCSQCIRSFVSKPEVIEFKGKMVLLCGKLCLEDFRKINVIMVRCEYCKISKAVKEVKKINGQDCAFCSEGCKLLYKHDLTKRWGLHCRNCAYCSCTTRKLVQNHFAGKLEEFCSDSCMSHFTVLFYQMAKCDTCKRQGKLPESLKWLGKMKHFCTVQCLIQFCIMNNNFTVQAPPAATVAPVTPAPAAPVVTSAAPPTIATLPTKEATPVIAEVVSLSSAPTGQPNASANTALQGTVPNPLIKVIGHASTQTDALKLPAAAARVLKNKALLCKPMSMNKGAICKPHMQSAETQTTEDFPAADSSPRVLIVPVPVPVFVPMPLHMYTQNTPYPVGLPIPVPVPMFLPTTLDSAERIVNAIQEIKEKIPADPYEADLILMADMVAQQQHEGQEEEKGKPVSHGDQCSSYSGDLESEAVSTPHSWEEEAMSANQPNRLLTHQDTQAECIDLEADYPVDKLESLGVMASKESSTTPVKHRGRRRPRDGFPSRKRGRKRMSPVVSPGMPVPCSGRAKLRHMYGVNAWRNWVQSRNSQPEADEPKAGVRPVTLKEDILQCSTAELSHGLCRFISEVRRPNQELYASDSIFYLCLCIQQYLLDNGRVENIFTDPSYSKFIQGINKLLKEWKPSVLPSGYVHARVEEDYLWECKQLGAYSPIVLLNTLLFFSTKFFHMKTSAEHRCLSFGNIIRCSRVQKDGKMGVLRFFMPAANKNGPDSPVEEDAVPGKRKREDEEQNVVLEMFENTENPLRCPIRLYEFYLSKCSDSVKQRADLFYLQPEHTCEPNSPLWYSPAPLDDVTMETMLTRILVVREVHLEGNEQQAAPWEDEAAV